MIVMKFGGTSVEDAKAIGRATEIVRGRLKEHPVVVVSALAKVTDQLLAIARSAATGDSKTALQLVEAFSQRHYEVAGELLAPARFTQLREDLGRDLGALNDLLRGISAVGELTPRTTDQVAAYGEILSSRIVAAAFSTRGLDSCLVDARACTVTDANYMRAAPLIDDTNERLQKLVAPLVDKGCVPVMGGFIGASKAGVTTTLGRGGSDYSAALVGAGLSAERIEIWTDVDGMLTTDPGICSNARRIEVLSFDEAAELAYFGAKVLHPATVLPAIQKNIPVYVLNSRNPTCEGTKITARAPKSRHMFKAIAVKKGITIVDVAAPRWLQLDGFLKWIVDAFARHSVSVDVISTSEVSLSVTVDTNEGIPSLTAELAKLADVKYEERKAIVCLVGENLRRTPGVAARVFRELEDVKIHMISQGASEINLTFVIAEEDVARVVERLHRAFFSDRVSDMAA